MRATHIFMMFVDMADLKPNVLFGERAGRVIDNVFKALNGQQTIAEMIIKDVRRDSD